MVQLSFMSWTKANCTGPFKRAAVPLLAPYDIMPNTKVGREPNQTVPDATCLVCSVAHPVGHCPLKQAGVEICRLCGIAHYGSGATRSCPHMQSVTQCRAMLETLKSSPEPRADIEHAKKYLVGVIGGLNRKKKSKVQALQPPTLASNGQALSPYASNMDVTGNVRTGKENLAVDRRNSSTAYPDARER